MTVKCKLTAVQILKNASTVAMQHTEAETVSCRDPAWFGMHAFGTQRHIQPKEWGSQI